MKKLRGVLGENENGTILAFVTVDSEYGQRAMGRHVIRDASHLVHGHTYLHRD